MPRAGAEPFSAGETISNAKKPRTLLNGLGSMLGVKYRECFIVVVLTKLDTIEEVFRIVQVGDFVDFDPIFVRFPI